MCLRPVRYNAGHSLMARDIPNSSAARAYGRAKAALSSRALYVWALLALALVMVFVIDGVVMEAVRPLHQSPFAEAINHSIRWLGTGYLQAGAILLVIAGSALLRLPTVRTGALLLTSFVLSGAAALALKVLVYRPRPWTDVSAEGWRDYFTSSKFQSFPSGESTTTFALAFVLARCYPKWRVPLFVVAAVIAGGRVVVGVHFPSDICAGAILGVGVGHLVARRACQGQGQGTAAAR